MLRTSRKANKHVEVEFTGDVNLYAVQMKKLEKQLKRQREKLKQQHQQLDAVGTSSSSLRER